MARLTGKVALVTGAAQGIGAAIARSFVAEGATVLLTDVRDTQGAELAHALGAAAHYARLDVREPDDWGRVTRDTLDQFGRLDVVVNNAGITGFEDGRRTTRNTPPWRRGAPSSRRTSTACSSDASMRSGPCAATSAPRRASAVS